MKKIFLFIMGIFLISLVSAGSCTESGYSYCQEDSYSYGDANAYAKVAWSFEDDNGIIEGVNWGDVSYPVGNLYIRSRYISDAYFSPLANENLLDRWSCSSSGCSISGSATDLEFYPTSSQGESQKIASIDQSFNECVVVGSLGHDRASNGDWAAVLSYYGWFGSQSCPTFNVVDCYDDSDCSGDKICDKSGEWQTWSCKTDPCEFITCEDKCQNSVRSFNGYCSAGDCVYETENCDFGCSGKFCADDLCAGVECDDKCENSVWSHDGSCNPSTGACTYTQDECQYGCENQQFLAIIVGEGMCRDDPCVGTTCDDYCSGTSLFYEGKCIGGECKQFKEKEYAEECGYIVDPWYKQWYVWVGGITFIIVSVFGVAYWRRRR